MRVYIASLSDYNNGRLEGKWFDLSDYLSASDLMNDIHDMLLDLTEKYNDGEVREEWAVHDYEGIPPTLASEYMGEADFQKLMDIREIAEDRNIAVEVLVERAGDTGSDDYEALADSLVMVVDGSDETDIVYELEKQMGELGNEFWSRYIFIDDVTKRVMYGEDVDRYREDILYEYPDMDEDEAERKAEEMADDEAEQRKDLSTYLQDMGYGDEIPNFVTKDYNDAWKYALSYDYDVIHHDDQMYVFTNNYSVGGTILSGLVGAYIGYKIGRAKPQKKGFETEKKIGRKIKGAFSKNKYADGGGIGFKGLSDKVAKRYEGKKVAPKYRGEYGKRYSKSEAKEVGDKVAGKIYWQQKGRKMAEGGKILQEISTHKAVKKGDKIYIYIKGMPIENAEDKRLAKKYPHWYEDELIRTIPAENEDDLFYIFENLQEENRINLSGYARGGGVDNYEMYDEQLYLDYDLKDAILENDTLNFIQERHFIRDKNGKLFMWIDWMDYDQFDKLANFLGYKYAQGGGVYSSDSMYELKVFDGKSSELLTTKRFRARNQREANELGQDYEYEMQQKYGDYLRFVVSEAKPLMARGGNVNKGRSWHLDRARHNKRESYEKPLTNRKRKYEDGGQIGQEIVFDDSGEENTGVIKDITNAGDYIVKADDGRTLLAQRQLDVISLGAMRSASTEAPRKRFGFFEDGGQIGQEIVFDDNGDENTGVIKDITNAGDYIVSSDDGRTLLAQRQLDVISLGAMRSAPTEAPRKRFGFFEEGGSVSGNQNKIFLDSLDISYKQRVLRNIANHYGISIVEAEEEVTDSESENLYEYITDTSLRMKVYNDMKNRRYAKGGGLSGLDEYKFQLKENDIVIDVSLITKIEAEKIQEIISKRTNSSDKENKYQAIITENNIVVDIANISRKTAIEIQDELDKKMANGADEVITINIQGYPYYLKKMGDTTHFKLANSKEGIDYVIGSHIGQHKGEEYYSDVASWLKGGKSPNGKSYNSFYYAQGGGVSGLDDLIRG